MRKVILFCAATLFSLLSFAQESDADIVKVGDNIPAFTLHSTANGTINSADLKGKVVLINIFATWCGPCQREIPHLQKLEEKYHGKDIYFEVDGERLNAWQTVEAYCDAITAMGYRLEDNYEANFAVYNESSVENIFTIPMSKTLYTNQMQYLFRSRHYNHAKAYGLGGENGSSATVEVLRTFGYDTEAVDPRFDKCYFAGIVYDLKGKVVTLDDLSLIHI